MDLDFIPLKALSKVWDEVAMEDELMAQLIPDDNYRKAIDTFGKFVTCECCGDVLRYTPFLFNFTNKMCNSCLNLSEVEQVYARLLSKKQDEIVLKLLAENKIEGKRKIKLKNLNKEIILLLKEDIVKLLRVYRLTELKYNPVNIGLDGITHEHHNKLLDDSFLSGYFRNLWNVREILDKLKLKANNCIGIVIDIEYNKDGKSDKNDFFYPVSLNVVKLMSYIRKEFFYGTTLYSLRRKLNEIRLFNFFVYFYLDKEKDLTYYFDKR